jgi:putative phage-type endonuclease
MRVVHHEQGSPEWLRWRADGIGGSDIAAILGLSPFPDATPEKLLKEKIERTTRNTNFAMRRGTFLEPKARAFFELRIGYLYVPLCVEHDDQSWMRVSLDGFCAQRLDLLEVKAANFKVHDYALSGLVPDYYLVQVQWQLITAGVKVGHFINYNDAAQFKGGNELAHVVVHEDAEQQAEIHTAAEEFWFKVCEGREALAVGRVSVPAGAY